MLEPISHVIYICDYQVPQSQGANVHVGIWKVHRREDFSFLPIRIYKIALTYIQRECSMASILIALMILCHKKSFSILTIYIYIYIYTIYM